MSRKTVLYGSDGESGCVTKGTVDNATISMLLYSDHHINILKDRAVGHLLSNILLVVN